MATKTLIGVWVFIAVLIGAVTIAGSGEQLAADTRAIVQFQRDADSYAFLHRRVERRQPALEITADVDAMRNAIDAMAAAMRAARADAREGDLFTPLVRQVLRTRIANAMRQNELVVADLAPEDGAATVTLRVNADMPWRVTNAVPACIVAVLPVVPTELQYRFAGADLLLVDVHANLIVDILRAAAIPIDTVR